MSAKCYAGVIYCPGHGKSLSCSSMPLCQVTLPFLTSPKTRRALPKTGESLENPALPGCSLRRREGAYVPGHGSLHSAGRAAVSINEVCKCLINTGTPVGNEVLVPPRNVRKLVGGNIVWSCCLSNEEFGRQHFPVQRARRLKTGEPWTINAGTSNHSNFWR